MNELKHVLFTTSKILGSFFQLVILTIQYYAVSKNKSMKNRIRSKVKRIRLKYGS